MRIITALFWLLLIPGNKMHAQSFVNGDLEGTITGYSSLPDLWDNVPYTDVVCNAPNPSAATPDLITLDAPSAELGVYGIAYSGSTYVAGVAGRSDETNIFHEGIMQEVSGFTPGNEYAIAFHQTVDARYLCEDTSGAWAVYLDTTLVGVTESTTSLVHRLSIELEWERREVYFIATAASHVIKFMPVDDDLNDFAEAWIYDGALSMAIDAISVAPAPVSISDLHDTPIGLVRYVGVLDALYLDPQHANKRYRILDMAGRVISRSTINSTLLPLTGLPQGAYLFQLDHNRNVWRFVK